MKLLKEKYKTWDGADKRCKFENGAAKFEFQNGIKSRHYHYTLVTETDYHTGAPVYRVARNNPNQE